MYAEIVYAFCDFCLYFYRFVYEKDFNKKRPKKKEKGPQFFHVMKYVPFDTIHHFMAEL